MRLRGSWPAPRRAVRYLSPAPLMVAAHAATKILRVVVGAREQLTGSGRLDDEGGPIAPFLRALGRERHPEVQPLAAVGIGDREQCGIGLFEISLIERDLRGVLRKCFLKPVALDRAPVFPIGRLVLPEERIIEVGAAQQVWSGNDDAVGVAAQASIHSGERQRLGRRELEAGGDQVLTCDVLEVVAAPEDIAHAGGQRGFAPPVKLNLAQALRADDAGAEVWSR